MSVYSSSLSFIDIPDIYDTDDANTLMDAANTDDISHFISVLQRVTYSEDVENIALYIAGEKNSPPILEAILKIGFFKSTALETIVSLIISFNSQKIVDDLWVRTMWESTISLVVKDSREAEQFGSELSRAIGKLIKKPSKNNEQVVGKFLHIVLESLSALRGKELDFYSKYIRYRLLAYLKPVKELFSLVDALDVKNRLDCLSKYILNDPWHIRKDLSIFILQELNNPLFSDPEHSVTIDKNKSIFRAINSLSKRSKECTAKAVLRGDKIAVLKLVKAKDIQKLLKNIGKWISIINTITPLVKAPAAQIKKADKSKLKEAKFVYEAIELRLMHYVKNITSERPCEEKIHMEVYGAFDINQNTEGAAIVMLNTDEASIRLQMLATHPDNLRITQAARVRGVGTALVKKIAEEALKRSTKEIRLYSTETAYDWYVGRLGFKPDIDLTGTLTTLSEDTHSIPDLVLDKDGMVALVYS